MLGVGDIIGEDKKSIKYLSRIKTLANEKTWGSLSRAKGWPRPCGGSERRRVTDGPSGVPNLLAAFPLRGREGKVRPWKG